MTLGPAPWRAADAAPLLSVPGPDSHKYSRGVLGLRTGSSAYPGAAALSAESAWRTGLGLVRFFSPVADVPPQFGLPSPAAAVFTVRPETVFTHDTAEDRARCDAWLIGSGTDPDTRSPAELDALLSLLQGDSPIVVDAGALGLLTEHRPSAPVIATPHLGEFRSLWGLAGLGDFPGVQGMQAQQAAAILARTLDVTVLLKGSRTVVASPAGQSLIVGPATPWLATAGTGDVLAGVIGALVATHAHAVLEDRKLLAQLGATAALLHDMAARIASGDANGTGDGAPITALDVAHAIPRAHAQLRAQ